jgi:aquaporin Z
LPKCLEIDSARTEAFPNLVLLLTSGAQFVTGRVRNPIPKSQEAIVSIGKRAAAECFGTFWLVFGGCGSAVLAAAFPGLGIGFAGVALAFGLTVLTMAYAIGHISGCHLNPAVSVGLVVGKRFPLTDLLPYVIAQLVGGVAGAGVLYIIASGQANFDITGGFASNGYGVHSPGGYSTVACLVAEVVLTMFFLLIIMGATDHRAPAGFAPIAIGAVADGPRRPSATACHSLFLCQFERAGSLVNTG